MREIAFKCPQCGHKTLKTTPDPDKDTPVVCDRCGKKTPYGKLVKDVEKQAAKAFEDRFRDIFKK